MEATYHRCRLKCPRCSKIASLTEICFNGEGQILISGLCAPCGLPLEFSTSFEKQVAFCHQADTAAQGFYQQGTGRVQ